MKICQIKRRQMAAKRHQLADLRALLRSQMQVYFRMGNRSAVKSTLLTMMRNTYRKISARKGLPLLQDMGDAAGFKPTRKQKRPIVQFIHTTGHVDAIPAATGNRRFFAVQLPDSAFCQKLGRVERKVTTEASEALAMRKAEARRRQLERGEVDL